MKFTSDKTYVKLCNHCMCSPELRHKHVEVPYYVTNPVWNYEEDRINGAIPSNYVKEKKIHHKLIYAIACPKCGTTTRYYVIANEAVDEWNELNYYRKVRTSDFEKLYTYDEIEEMLEYREILGARCTKWTNRHKTLANDANGVLDFLPPKDERAEGVKQWVVTEYSDNEVKNELSALEFAIN